MSCSKGYPFGQPPRRLTVSRGGRSIRSPVVHPLPSALRIARALRLLMRRQPSRVVSVFDETSTIEKIIRKDVIILRFKPAQSRWFEIVLVVDRSPSMAVWQATIRKFQHLLERQGAFQNGRSWSLVTDADDQEVRLYPSLKQFDASKLSHSPNELVNPSGQQIIL